MAAHLSVRLNTTWLHTLVYAGQYALVCVTYAHTRAMWVCALVCVSGSDRYWLGPPYAHTRALQVRIHRTILARKFRKFIFQEICVRVKELSEGRAEALQRRRDARHGRASPIPRSGALSGPPSRSWMSKVASS